MTQFSTLPGPNINLMGPAGTGKTYSLGTLVEAGVKVRYLGLEPGLESLLGYFTDRGKEIPENLAWHQLKAPSASFAEMITSAEKINTLNLESLSKLQDQNRSQHNQFISLLQALNDFKDDRTGKSLGAVNSWEPDCAIAIDGLTGIGRAAMALVVGGKPVRSQSDWGIAQDQVEKLIRMLCDNCNCWFVLLSHVERETDLVLGGVKLMPATLGKVLAPKIPAMFSDVILTTRNADKWVWDTASAQADVKTRNLPIKSDNPADFRPIVEKWKSRGGKL